MWEEPPCERRVAPLPVHPRTLQHTISQRSSEDSWCSASDPELSSDEESDRSAASSTRLVILFLFYSLRRRLSSSTYPSPFSFFIPFINKGASMSRVLAMNINRRIPPSVGRAFSINCSVVTKICRCTAFETAFHRSFFYHFRYEDTFY